MVEKKIYNSWAYQANETEKNMMNSAIYDELVTTHRIARSSKKYNAQKKCFEDINLDDYDVVVENSGVGYGHTLYKIVKNAPKLSNDELALICDEGNLCFGYAMRSGRICIYTD